MRNFTFNITIECGDTIHYHSFEGSGECEFYSFTLSSDNERMNAVISPKKSLRLLEVTACTPLECTKKDRIMLNGYQSWTDTRELTIRDRMHGLRRAPKALVKKFAFDGYGDYAMVDYSGKKGELHGFSYGYIRRGEQYELVASLSERNGYTIIKYSAKNSRLSLCKECSSLVIDKPYTAFDICILQGGMDEVFDRWFELMGTPKPKAQPMSGYTSWYHHYQNINEQIITENLSAMETLPVKADIFQIDDGFETAVGDWLSVDAAKFPNGLEPIVQQIHERGMLAGLWLAPFVCQEDSALRREHPDWLRCDKDGNAIKCGSNWGGFYALDLYNDEVVAYLRTVFDTVLGKWGFDMVKLDFLYAADRIAAEDKTRGQQMCEAMDLLRELVGDKLILGCGVPLAPAFGKVDFCRVGSDVGLDWNDKWYMRLMHRERVSTRNTICDTIYRRTLDGRAFLNDPDVFLLRDENIHLSRKRKTQLATVNGLLGSLRFTSDNYSLYDEKKRELYKRVIGLRSAKVKSVTDSRRKIIIRYSESGQERVLKIRL